MEPKPTWTPASKPDVFRGLHRRLQTGRPMTYAEAQSLLDYIHTLEVSCAALEEQIAELREHIAREVTAAVQDDDLEILAQLYMAGG